MKSACVGVLSIFQNIPHWETAVGTVTYYFEYNKFILVKQVGLTLSQATKALRESRGIALLYFLPRHQKGVRGQRPRTGRILPPGKTRYPLYRRLGGPQGRSGQVRKISHPPGFDPRTLHHVGSRYTDYATRPTTLQLTIRKCLQSVELMRCTGILNWRIN